MAWTAPRTWVTGELVTAAYMNTHVRDEFLYIYPDAAWANRTPTLTNITLGTGGTNQQRYIQMGKTVMIRGSITLGTGGALTGSPTVNVPTTAATVTNMIWVGAARYHDPGTRLWVGICYITSAGTTIAFVQSQGGTGNLSATEPFTWGNTDELSYAIDYEVA